LEKISENCRGDFFDSHCRIQGSFWSWFDVNWFLFMNVTTKTVFTLHSDLDIWPSIALPVARWLCLIAIKFEVYAAVQYWPSWLKACDRDGWTDWQHLTWPPKEAHIINVLRPMAHDPSSLSKLLVPESCTRNLEVIEHVLFCPSFWYQINETNLVPECITLSKLLVRDF